jgi:5-methyltetrahydrofolate--homocysteine methyltransferase
MTLGTLLSSQDAIILDGAMGTELERRGIPERCEANLRNPGGVAAVHADYLAAGCTGIITNTLTMNRIFIETHKLTVDVREVNLCGARLACTAAGGAALVLGDISSTGQLLEPYGSLTEAEAVQCYKEQAQYLEEGGVHAFIIETVMDLREAVCALKACKAVSRLPVIACISFNTLENGGRTIMGDSARGCAERLTEEGADAVGANCGSLDPLEMAQIISHMRAATRLPLCAEPNAGKPRLSGGTTVFDMDPEAYVRGVLACRDAGARVLGGCCGTTPAHIKELADAVKKRSTKS